MYERDSLRIILKNKFRKWWASKITPTRQEHPTSWYIKWVGTFFVLTAISTRSLGGSTIIDLCMSIGGTSCWLIVGYIWRDRSLIVLNVVACTLLLAGIVNYLR